MKNKFSAIIVAAGAGKRMRADIPKQFLTLGDKPILQHTLDAFGNSPVDEIILVISKGSSGFINQLGINPCFKGKETRIVYGGNERYMSVWEGIKASAGDYVLVHDGARPFVSLDLINRCIADVERFDATIAAVPVVDTIKQADEDGFVSSTLDRATLFSVQTPQCFKRELIVEAFERFLQNPACQKMGITDDAMLVEQFTDVKVHITPGEPENIKITTKKDLK